MGSERKVRLLVSDIDGTLLNDAKEVTDATIAALRRASDLGIAIALASGRKTSSIRLIAARLGVPCYIIGYNGAEVRHGEDQLLHEPLPVTVSDVLIDYCDTNTLQLNLYFANDTNGLYARDHPDLVPMSSQYGTMNLSPVTLVPSLKCFSGTEVTKALIIVNDSHHREELRKALKPIIGDAHLINTHSTNAVLQQHQDYLEFMNCNANKGIALKRLCESIGVSLAEVVAFGDSDNDLEMLEVAGTSICMAQGTPAAKRASTRVSQWSNHEHGVAREVEILCNAFESRASW